MRGAAIALRATFSAPRTSTMVPLPVSSRTTISGSSTARSASNSPSRAAARKASTTSSWCAGASAWWWVVCALADAAASAAGELARRLGRALQDGADLLEGNREHVVKDVG